MPPYSSTSVPIQPIFLYFEPQMVKRESTNIMPRNSAPSGQVVGATRQVFRQCAGYPTRFVMRTNRGIEPTSEIAITVLTPTLHNPKDELP